MGNKSQVLGIKSSKVACEETLSISRPPSVHSMRLEIAEEEKTPTKGDPDKLEMVEADNTEILNVMEFQSPAPMLGKRREDKKMDLIEDCAICLETFEDETDIVKTPCEHVFHLPCLKTWIENRMTS